LCARQNDKLDNASAILKTPVHLDRPDHLENLALMEHQVWLD